MDQEGLSDEEVKLQKVEELEEYNEEKKQTEQPA